MRKTLRCVKYLRNSTLRLFNFQSCYHLWKPTCTMADGRELPNKIKYVTAAVIYFGNMAYGAALNSYGPVITTLQHKYGVDDASISKTFSILTVCSLLGALIGGTVIYDRVNRQLAVAIIISIKAFGIIVTPHCPTLTTFFITAGVVGTCAGAYDTAQFVWIVEMMQKDCPPFVQAQHFFYAFGTILGTLIMAQFLSDDPAMSIAEKSEKLVTPFAIVGSMVAVHAILQIVLFTFFRYFKPPPEAQESENERLQDNGGSRLHPSPAPILCGTQLWNWPKLRLVVLSCAFYGTYCGMEMTTIQFFPKFGQNSPLKLSEQTSAYVLTALTAAFAAGRGIAIILVLKLRTLTILYCNITLIIIANVLLITWAESSLSVFWAASIIFGLGFSSTYASFAAFIERHLNITNFVGSVLLVVSYGVAAVYPMIIGSFIETNPIVLSYVIFFSICVISVSVGILSFLTFNSTIKY